MKKLLTKVVVCVSVMAMLFSAGLAFKNPNTIGIACDLPPIAVSR